MSKETIWDYKPTEEEMQRMFDFFEKETKNELENLFKSSERNNLASLYVLFEVRGDFKNLERIKDSYIKYQKQHPFRDRES